MIDKTNNTSTYSYEACSHAGFSSGNQIFKRVSHISHTHACGRTNREVPSPLSTYIDRQRRCYRGSRPKTQHRHRDNSLPLSHGILQIVSSNSSLRVGAITTFSEWFLCGVESTHRCKYVKVINPPFLQIDAFRDSTLENGPSLN